MNTRRVVYVIGSAAPPIFDIEELLRLLQDCGWQPCLILTPTAASWIQATHMDEIADCPVRINPRRPREAESLPPAGAVLVAPLTFNTANKWATGINDTLALGLLNELLCEEIPIIAAPCVKKSLRDHPAYNESMSRLERCGIRILQDKNVTIRKGTTITLSWKLLVDTLESIE